MQWSVTRRNLLGAGALVGVTSGLNVELISSPLHAATNDSAPIPPMQPGIRAGELAFAVADARGAGGAIVGSTDVAGQTATSLAHLRGSLRALGLDLDRVISLWVMLPDYARADDVMRVINEQWPDPKSAPALTILGNSGLDGGCTVRLDAIASTSADRRAIIVPGVPLPPGVKVHGVFAGGMAYLSGLSAPDQQGSNAGDTLYRQVGAILDRMNVVLQSQKLSLGDVGRTWMFQRDLSPEVRLSYGRAREERYKGIFDRDKFPANSGIQMPNLGNGVMIRSVAFAGPNKTYVVSDKVRLSPGSFSQAVRYADWLHICGVDAYDLKRQLEAPGDLAGQTERCMEYTRFIVEAAGGKMEDIVKTTTYIVAGEDRMKFSGVYQKYFERFAAGRMPSSLVADVQQLSPGILVEIDSVAYLGRR